MAADPFPDVRWGRDHPTVRRVVTAFAGSKTGSWCVRRLAPVDRWLLSRSRGHLTILGPLGVPLLLLTSIGRKSGERRQIPLLYLREDDRLFLVGSNFGQNRHPAWALNLLADSQAWVTMGGKEIPVVAASLTGSERERIFGKFVEYAGNYATYRHRTDRDIKVFALTGR